MQILNSSENLSFYTHLLTKSQQLLKKFHPFIHFDLVFLNTPQAVLSPPVHASVRGTYVKQEVEQDRLLKLPKL